MKSVRNLFVVFLILNLMVGCGKKEESLPGAKVPKPTTQAQPAEELVSAEKTSFAEVTAHLNRGGSLYLYLSTENFLSKLSETVLGWRQIVLALAALDKGAQADITEPIHRGFDILSRFIKNSGVEDISGVGASSVAREKGLYFQKWVLHHYRGKREGYLWNVFGKTPHPLQGLDYCSDKTAWAWFGDVDVPLIWSSLDKAISEANLPEVSTNFKNLPFLVEMMGLKWDPLMGSMGGEFGVIFTLDESKKINLPLGNEREKVEIPEPGLILMMKVKDDTLFHFIDQQLKSNPQVTSSDKNGVKIRTIPFGLPLPLELSPSVGRSGEYLFVATHEALIEKAVAVRAGKSPGLRTTAEFKRLSQGVPEEGNQWMFMSKVLSQNLAKIQFQRLNPSSKEVGIQEAFEKLFGMGSETHYYGVNRNTEEGWMTTLNTTVDFSKTLAMQGAAITGMLAGVAVPSWVRARERAQATMILSEARRLDAAKDQHLLSSGKAGAPTFEDLSKYLDPHSKLVKRGGKDPLGGTYRLGDEKGSVSVDPRTKEALKNATGGDAFWGPYS